jgi:hypothetical protein
LWEGRVTPTPFPSTSAKKAAPQQVPSRFKLIQGIFISIGSRRLSHSFLHLSTKMVHGCHFSNKFLRKKYVDLRFSTHIIVNSNIFYYFRGGLFSNSYGAWKSD